MQKSELTNDCICHCKAIDIQLSIFTVPCKITQTPKIINFTSNTNKDCYYIVLDISGVVISNYLLSFISAAYYGLIEPPDLLY